ncbi:MAG: hypothetical protein EXS42_09140 [Lacunisphaera sp.]|nr:hypothetical protein [Lacunisphaera sp.]
MNKFYLIVPAMLLAVFAVLYSGARKEMVAKQVAQHEAKVKAGAEEKIRKTAIEAAANAEARSRQEERAATDRARGEKKQRDYDDAMKKLKDEANGYAAQADMLAKEAASTEIQISLARSDKEKLSREALELAKQVEQAKIDRRSAELEIQRMIEIVGRKLNESSIAVPPPPPSLVAK